MIRLAISLILGMVYLSCIQSIDKNEKEEHPDSGSSIITDTTQSRLIDSGINLKIENAVLSNSSISIEYLIQNLNKIQISVLTPIVEIGNNNGINQVIINEQRFMIPDSTGLISQPKLAPMKLSKFKYIKIKPNELYLGKLIMPLKDYNQAENGKIQSIQLIWDYNRCHFIIDENSYYGYNVFSGRVSSNTWYFK